MKKEPETSFEFIKEWFGKARDNAKRAGRKDSAQLWADGLAHLEYMRNKISALESEIDELASK